jgi:hypothetical protein
MLYPAGLAAAFFFGDIRIDANGILAKIGNAPFHGLALIEGFKTFVRQPALGARAGKHPLARVLLKEAAQHSQTVTHLEHLLNIIIGQK